MLDLSEGGTRPQWAGIVLLSLPKMTSRLTIFRDDRVDKISKADGVCTLLEHPNKKVIISIASRNRHAMQARKVECRE